MNKDLQAALANCEKEAVQIPGAVQSFAAIALLHSLDLNILATSENLKTLLGTTCSGLPTTLSELGFSNELEHAVRGSLGLSTISMRRERIGTFQKSSSTFDCSVFQAGSSIVLEVEPVQSMETRLQSSIQKVRSLLNGLSDEGDLPKLYQSAAKLLRLHTGYDRVMVYSFLPDGCAELFAEAFPSKLQHFIDGNQLLRKKRVASICNGLRNSNQENDAIHALSGIADDLLDIFNVHGFAFHSNGQFKSFGSVPCENLILHLAAQSDEGLQSSTNRILQNVDGYEQCDWRRSFGYVILRFLGSKAWLILFRDEIIEEVRWGGMPLKKIEYGPHGPRLHPRSSFEEYREKVAGLCEPWLHEDLAAIRDLKESILEILLRDSTRFTQETIQNQRHLDTLLLELDHRVKNTLAVVLSLAHQTRQENQSVESYVESLEERIRALATAHDLATQGGWRNWISFRAFCRSCLHLALIEPNFLLLSGEDLEIRSEVASTFALVLHELLTNSLKYGAPKHRGTISVQWSRVSGGLAFYWHEMLPQPLETLPTRRGFGMTLIEKALAYEFGGTSNVKVDLADIKVEQWIPAEYVRLNSTLPTPISNDLPNVEECMPCLPNFGQSILVLEDNILLSMELEQELRSWGLREIWITSSNDEAVQKLNAKSPTIAILDIQVGQETSFEFAEKLMLLRIPFAFLTGYDSRLKVPAKFSGAPVLSKPIRKNALRQCLSSLFKRPVNEDNSYTRG